MFTVFLFKNDKKLIFLGLKTANLARRGGKNMVFMVGIKLISLNTYGVHFFAPLMDFIKMQAQSTDVFCFQEVLSNLKGGMFISHGS